MFEEYHQWAPISVKDYLNRAIFRFVVHRSSIPTRVPIAVANQVRGPSLTGARLSHLHG